MKWKEDLAAAYDMLTRNSKHGLVSASSVGNVAAAAELEQSFYENVGFNVASEVAVASNNDSEGVYDIPRPRNLDTLYFNDAFDDEGRDAKGIFRKRKVDPKLDCA